MNMIWMERTARLLGVWPEWAWSPGCLMLTQEFSHQAPDRGEILKVRLGWN